MASTLIRLCAAGLFTAALGAGAATAGEALSSANIIKVQAGGGDMHGSNEQAERRNQRFNNRFDYRSDRRDWRDRDRNDWVAPAVGFLGGLAIGGALGNSAPPPAPYMPPVSPYAPYGSSNPHVDWCLANVPGYNPYDNTYQAYYGGPRYYCQSPYGG